MSERRDRMRRIRRDKRRQNRKDRSIRKILRVIFGWILSVLIAGILGYAIVTFFFQTVYMVGSSMSPTIENGEKRMVYKAAYWLGNPDRYDIVAYRLIENSDEYYDIKRVIGLPGETVSIRDGKVYINDTALTDMPSDDYIFTAGVTENDLVLGEDEYFLMGDNVNNSQDSRFVNIGSVRKSEILGEVKGK